jgi:murein DD-endopeptidase MepM/ murein hydrolase activator NlpD
MPVSATPSLAPIAVPLTATPGISRNPSATPLSFDPVQLQTVTPQVALASQSSAVANSTTVEGWNPPPLRVPLAYGPFDHYWLRRPVGSNNENSELAYYPYGSDGPGNDLRIHHGIDLANPIGVQVFAAGDGTVTWADKGHFNEFESITAYGNTIVIEHDFGYNGQHVYTLYAHLSSILVTKGEHVQQDQVIGLIGNTGNVTGPHVHFEIRIGRDGYYATRNPVLWMAPYVGTGVIAGRIAFPDGSAVADAVITLYRSRYWPNHTTC